MKSRAGIRDYGWQLRAGLLGVLLLALQLGEASAQQRLALMQHSGRRSARTAAIMNAVRELLPSDFYDESATRALLRQRAGRDVSRPSGRVSVESLVRYVDNANDAWVQGKFELAISRVEVAMRLARQYPTLTVTPQGLYATRRALIINALAYGRLATTASAAAVVAQTEHDRQQLVHETTRYVERRNASLWEIARSFPAAPIRQSEFGKEGEAMFGEVVQGEAALGRGELLLDIQHLPPASVLSVNESVHAQGAALRLLPGRYRVLVQTPTLVREYEYDVAVNQHVRVDLDWRYEGSLEVDEWLGFRFALGATPPRLGELIARLSVPSATEDVLVFTVEDQDGSWVELHGTLYTLDGVPRRRGMVAMRLAHPQFGRDEHLLLRQLLDYLDRMPSTDVHPVPISDQERYVATAVVPGAAPEVPQVVSAVPIAVAPRARAHADRTASYLAWSGALLLGGASTYAFVTDENTWGAVAGLGAAALVVGGTVLWVSSTPAGQGSAASDTGRGTVIGLAGVW